jgi:hypothetical protein
MFHDPKITQQLANDRLEGARREAADRRLAGVARRHRRNPSLKTAWTNWFRRGERPVATAKPTPA